MFGFSVVAGEGRAASTRFHSSRPIAPRIVPSYLEYGTASRVCFPTISLPLNTEGEGSRFINNGWNDFTFESSWPRSIAARSRVPRERMVWDDGLSVKELTEMRKKTPRFPSRERNFAMRRRGVRRTFSLSLGGLTPLPGPQLDIHEEERANDNSTHDRSCNNDVCQP